MSTVTLETVYGPLAVDLESADSMAVVAGAVAESGQPGIAWLLRQGPLPEYKDPKGQQHIGAFTEVGYHPLIVYAYICHDRGNGWQTKIRLDFRRLATMTHPVTPAPASMLLWPDSPERQDAEALVSLAVRRRLVTPPQSGHLAKLALMEAISLLPKDLSVLGVYREGWVGYQSRFVNETGWEDFVCPTIAGRP